MSHRAAPSVLRSLNLVCAFALVSAGLAEGCGSKQEDVVAQYQNASVSADVVRVHTTEDLLRDESSGGRGNIGFGCNWRAAYASRVRPVSYHELKLAGARASVTRLECVPQDLKLEPHGDSAAYLCDSGWHLIRFARNTGYADGTSASQPALESLPPFSDRVGALELAGHRAILDSRCIEDILSEAEAQEGSRGLLRALDASFEGGDAYVTRAWIDAAARLGEPHRASLVDRAAVILGESTSSNESIRRAAYVGRDIRVTDPAKRALTRRWGEGGPSGDDRATASVRSDLTLRLLALDRSWIGARACERVAVSSRTPDLGELLAIGLSAAEGVRCPRIAERLTREDFCDQPGASTGVDGGASDSLSKRATAWLETSDPLATPCPLTARQALVFAAMAQGPLRPELTRCNANAPR